MKFIYFKYKSNFNDNRPSYYCFNIENEITWIYNHFTNDWTLVPNRDTSWFNSWCLRLSRIEMAIKNISPICYENEVKMKFKKTIFNYSIVSKKSKTL